MTDGARHVLALGVSVLAAILLVIVAGTSDAAGTTCLVFIVGLWLVWLVRHPSLGASVTNALGSSS